MSDILEQALAKARQPVSVSLQRGHWKTVLVTLQKQQKADARTRQNIRRAEVLAEIIGTITEAIADEEGAQ
jgi:hypothetical protein